MLGGKQLASTPHPRLNFVGHEQDAVFFCGGRESRQELFLGDVVAAFALNRLHDDRGDFIGRGDGVKQRLEVVEALHITGLGLAVHGTAIALCVIRMMHLGEHRPVAAALHRFARRQRRGAHRASMKSSKKADDLLASRPEPSKFDGGFHRLRSRVREENPGILAHGSDGREPFGELHDRSRVEIGRTHVKELPRLRADRRNDVRVAMSRRTNRNPGCEIQEAIPVRIGDHQPRSFLYDQWIVSVIVLRHDTKIALDEGSGFGAGKRRLDRRR